MMPSALHNIEILPLGAQFFVADSEYRDYPQWASGDELLVRNRDCIAIATDQSSDPIRLAIQVVKSMPDADLLALEELDLRSGRLVFGNVEAGQIATILVAEVATTALIGLGKDTDNEAFEIYVLARTR